MIAVTTHSRTRGMRYTARMLFAGWLIQRQLRDSAGCERYAQVLASPRELWTLTIWRDEAELRTCMRQGAHGKLMWQQPRWLECYWGMRWRPGSQRFGDWPGKARHRADATTPELPPSLTLPTPHTPLKTLGRMQAALGKTARLEQRQVAGAGGVTYRLQVPPWRIPEAIRTLRRLGRAVFADRESFRSSLGLGTGCALYLLVIATSAEVLDRVQARPEHLRFLQRWGDRAWWSTWEPDSEFGHWKSYKLRDGQLVGEPLVIDVGLPAHLSAAGQARAVLRAQLGALDMASLDVVLVLTSELVANSVRHGGLGTASSTGLQVRANSEWIRVEVLDRGRRFEPRVPLSKPSDDESGWGLFILDKMADRWGIIEHPDDVRRIWFELRIPVRDETEPN